MVSERGGIIIRKKIWEGLEKFKIITIFAVLFRVSNRDNYKK